MGYLVYRQFPADSCEWREWKRTWLTLALALDAAARDTIFKKSYDVMNTLFKTSDGIRVGT